MQFGAAGGLQQVPALLQWPLTQGFHSLTVGNVRLSGGFDKFCKVTVSKKSGAQHHCALIGRPGLGYCQAVTGQAVKIAGGVPVAAARRFVLEGVILCRQLMIGGEKHLWIGPVKSHVGWAQTEQAIAAAVKEPEQDRLLRRRRSLPRYCEANLAKQGDQHGGAQPAAFFLYLFYPMERISLNIYYISLCLQA